jgi:SpoVK/Ycf46/Vps4 family AAA+-type ATPase
MTTRRKSASAKKKATARKKAPQKKRARPARAPTEPVRDTAEEQVEMPGGSESKERELVLAWFRLLARCRGAWLQHLWMDEGSIDGRATVSHAELAGILADQDSPEAEGEWSQTQEPVRQWREEANKIKHALDEDKNSRFTHLAQLFGLTPPEQDLLLLAAAVAFDPGLARVCAYLQDHSGRLYLTEELASRLLMLDRVPAWPPEMNVFRWELIQRRDTGVGEPVALICDPQLRDWLTGRSTLDEVLVGAARIIDPNGGALPEWPVDEIAEWIDTSLRNPEPPRLRIIVTAPRGGGKRDFAAAVASKLRMPMLLVDSDASDDASWRRFFMHAQRQAFLDAAILAWTGETAARQRWLTGHSLFPLQFSLCEPDTRPAEAPGVTDRLVQLPMPEAKTREQLWKQSAPQANEWPADEIQRLAAHHTVWPGDIQRAIRLGAATPADATARVREAARSRFGNLAQILECPFDWEDLVLPPGVKRLLEGISFEAEERGAFWQQKEARRLFPQGRGLVALFSGPSGTGKTMAAQVIASQLTQDLCRVNVAQLVSKWVGETSKNIEEVIRVAAENNVVLFFDEADALFARRATEIRDAQDRFANTDTAFLLQAIESYPGIAILATNLRLNIDAAFLRRIRYLVEFPKPDAALQRELWTRLVTALAGVERADALVGAFELLSTATEATGAQIKFAVLGAWFAARADNQPLNVRHLLTGLDRELAKEGRAIGPRERDQILRVEEAA